MDPLHLAPPLVDLGLPALDSGSQLGLVVRLLVERRSGCSPLGIPPQLELEEGVLRILLGPECLRLAGLSLLGLLPSHPGLFLGRPDLLAVPDAVAPESPFVAVDGLLDTERTAPKEHGMGCDEGAS